MVTFKSFQEQSADTLISLGQLSQSAIESIIPSIPNWLDLEKPEVGFRIAYPILKQLIISKEKK
ncbi:hypothetical protein WQ54_02110 [Bacillus sp. SA1-12]|nr:hypothetical protein WQ54_02110 [Bacillus sp. SA1-12]